MPIQHFWLKHLKEFYVKQKKAGVKESVEFQWKGWQKNKNIIFILLPPFGVIISTTIIYKRGLENIENIQLQQMLREVISLMCALAVFKFMLFLTNEHLMVSGC